MSAAIWEAECALAETKRTAKTFTRLIVLMGLARRAGEATLQYLSCKTQLRWAAVRDVGIDLQVDGLVEIEGKVDTGGKWVQIDLLRLTEAGREVVKQFAALLRPEVYPVETASTGGTAP